MLWLHYIYDRGLPALGGSLVCWLADCTLKKREQETEETQSGATAFLLLHFKWAHQDSYIHIVFR